MLKKAGFSTKKDSQTKRFPVSAGAIMPEFTVLANFIYFSGENFAIMKTVAGKITILF